MRRLKLLRLQKGLSQKEFAEQIHASQNTISQWENGTRKPSYDVIQNIASFFDVSVDYLLGLTEEEPKIDLNKMTAKEILAYAKEQNETTYDILGYDGENATRTTLTKDEYEKLLGIIEVLRKENN